MRGGRCPPPKSRPEPRALSAPSLGTNPWRPMPPRRPRLIKGLPAPRALSSPTRTFNKILWETVIYSMALALPLRTREVAPADSGPSRQKLMLLAAQNTRSAGRRPFSSEVRLLDDPSQNHFWSSCSQKVRTSAYGIDEVMGRTSPKIAPPRFVGPLNHGRFVHNAAPPYHNLFRPFRYHPGAPRSPLKPVETASGC